MAGVELAVIMASFIQSLQSIPVFWLPAPTELTVVCSAAPIKERFYDDGQDNLFCHAGLH